ncbi:MAG: alpha/beta hydrolase [Leptospiraceae bacterium]|nr:alpha/beta hydrolase [Leptospiraceae bacterium]
MELFEGYVSSNGLKLYCKYLPSGNKPPIVLIMGLSFQMTTWPDSLIHLLHENDFPVLIFDNRDIGLSEKISSEPIHFLPLSFLQFVLGFKIESPYTLYDMANDTIGLLDYFQISKAHLLGMSMGGMISQIIAAQSPSRVESLNLLSTTDNSPHSLPPSPEMLWRLIGSGISGHDKDSAIERIFLVYKSIRSKAFYEKDEVVLEKIERGFHRSYSPDGAIRQIYAILSSPNLQNLHSKISCPTRILHGDSDPLIHNSAAKRLAKSIPGAELKILEGYAHDIPSGLVPILYEYFFKDR